jgi:hypothetical protein
VASPQAIPPAPAVGLPQRERPGRVDAGFDQLRQDVVAVAFVVEEQVTEDDLAEPAGRFVVPHHECSWPAANRAGQGQAHGPHRGRGCREGPHPRERLLGGGDLAVVAAVGVRHGPGRGGATPLGGPRDRGRCGRSGLEVSRGAVQVLDDG